MLEVFCVEIFSGVSKNSEVSLLKPLEIKTTLVIKTTRFHAKNALFSGNVSHY